MPLKSGPKGMCLPNKQMTDADSGWVNMTLISGFAKGTQLLHLRNSPVYSYIHIYVLRFLPLERALTYSVCFEL